MKPGNFKPLKKEDFKLSSEELKQLVEGAQKFLPPADESGNPIPQGAEEPPKNANQR